MMSIPVDMSLLTLCTILLGTFYYVNGCFRAPGHVRHDSGGLAKPDAGRHPSAPSSPRSQGRDKVKRNLKDHLSVSV